MPGLFLGTLVWFAIGPLLFVLFDPGDFVVLAAIGTLPLPVVDLGVVARVAYGVLAVARVELLLDVLQLILAHVADVVPTNFTSIRVIRYLFVIVFRVFLTAARIAG